MRVQEQRTLECVVSSSGGEVRTIDIDRDRLCTGDVGASRALGTTPTSPFFPADFTPSRAGSLGLCGSGVVEGNFSRCGVSGDDGTLIDLRLCERLGVVVPFAGCCGDPSAFRMVSFLGSMKPISTRRVSSGRVHKKKKKPQALKYSRSAWRSVSCASLQSFPYLQ